MAKRMEGNMMKYLGKMKEIITFSSSIISIITHKKIRGLIYMYAAIIPQVVRLNKRSIGREVSTLKKLL